MTWTVTRLKQRSQTWSNYYAGLIMLWGLVLLGPWLVFYGNYADHRDRPSLQWPKVSGTIEQCREVYGGGKYSSFRVAISYSYVINRRVYLEHQIALWNSNLSGDEQVGDFVTAHPVKSQVDVYYDPQDPDNAVLIPGPNEVRNHKLIQAGTYCFVPLLLMALVLRKQLVRIKAALQSVKTRGHAHGPATATGLPHGYASYEPGSKRKLNVFPDKECLLEVLGHKGAPLQQWKPEDRMIDAAGREYWLVKEPDKNCYDLDPTGETWSLERLLDAAEADFRWLKKDPEALRRRLNDVPEVERMPVLLKSMDDGPAGSRWVMPGFILFLVLFALAVMFGAAAIFSWLMSWLQK